MVENKYELPYGSNTDYFSYDYSEYYYEYNPYETQSELSCDNIEVEEIF